MTLEEAKKAIDELKTEGLTNQEIAIVLHDMFRDDKLTVDELNDLVGLVGYHLTEEFRNMSPEKQKEPLYETLDGEDYDEEDGFEDGEAKTDGQKDENPGEGEEPKKPEPDAEPESEEEKARKLFGLNK